MRVFLTFNCIVTGCIPIAVPWHGGEHVNVDHEELRHQPEPELALELEVDESGAITHVWLGPDGKLSSIPLELASAFLGPDSPQRRAKLILLATRLDCAKRYTWSSVPDTRTLGTNRCKLTPAVGGGQ